MTFEEAKVLAKKGVKMTHDYFATYEYMTMQGNIIIFEDSAKIFADEWIADKPGQKMVGLNIKNKILSTQYDPT